MFYCMIRQQNIQGLIKQTDAREAIVLKEISNHYLDMMQILHSK